MQELTSGENLKAKSKNLIMDEKAIRRALVRISHEILERNKDAATLGIIGIRTRGAHLAERIAGILSEIEKIQFPVGFMDITFYRDDIGERLEQPTVQKTEIMFDVKDKNIVLIDDVLFTGRTIRAAMDEIIDFGRPATIQLAVLIDRGHRELPIRPDYVGKSIPTSLDEQVVVKVKEIDGEDSVQIMKVVNK